MAHGPATGSAGRARLYTEFASWWPLLSAPEEYGEEAEFYGLQLRNACAHPPSSLLELGCGGGNNGFHMKARFREVVLSDQSPEMVAVSRALNPECEHVVGDMRTLRLDRQFDCVFVQDAVCYMTTEADLSATFETAYVHCRPGGAALFAPDHLAETFAPSTDCGGHDGEGRALRYLEWTWDPDPTDTTYTVDLAYVLRERDGTVRAECDRHILGLFSGALWLRLLETAGFRPRIVRFDHSEVEPGCCHVLVAGKPAEGAR